MPHWTPEQVEKFEKFVEERGGEVVRFTRYDSGEIQFAVSGLEVGEAQKTMEDFVNETKLV